VNDDDDEFFVAFRKDCGVQDPILTVLLVEMFLA
jgi:hypothetical protein